MLVPIPNIRSNYTKVASALHLDWAYPAADKRDLRLDFLRGFAVFVMVIDHWGGASWLYLITGGNAFFVSGAEAFVFISGVVVGMVYGGIALKQSLRDAQLKALSRAFTLYKLTVVLTLLFAGISFFFQLPWVRDVDPGSPLAFIANTLSLHQTMYLTDITLIYTFLMLSVPVSLWLLVRGRTVWMLAISSALWVASQLFSTQFQVPWQFSGSTAFDLAAWQFLFNLAIVIGYHRQTITEKLSGLSRPLLWVLSGVLVVWLVQLHGTNGAVLAQMFPGLDIQTFMTTFFNKSTLAPGRIIASAVVFSFAYLTTSLFWKPITKALGWFLLPLGQNSLYSYTMHVVLITLFYVALVYLPGDIRMQGITNTLLQLAAVVAIWAMIQRKFLFNIVPR